MNAKQNKILFFPRIKGTVNGDVNCKLIQFNQSLGEIPKLLSIYRCEIPSGQWSCINNPAQAFVDKQCFFTTIRKKDLNCCNVITCELKNVWYALHPAVVAVVM